MRASHITLRLGTTDDARAIALMSRDLIEHGLGWSWREPRVARHIADRETSTIVACDGATLAGFAIMQFGDEVAHLNLLAVEREYQRGGIGRGLFEWMRESALAAGIAVIHLELRANNQGARRFYKALGFQERGFIPFYYSGRETALRMALVLRSV